MALEKCLCTFSLRTGTLIIGVVFMVLAVVDVAFSIYRCQGDEDLDRFHNIIWTARISDWVLEAGNFIVSGLLIYGTIKKKEMFLVWWIWYIGVLGVVVLTLLVGAVLMYLAFQMNLEATIGTAISLGGSLLVVHALRVVHSYRIQLMEMSSIPHVILSKTPPSTPISEMPNKDSPPRYIPLK